jgi:archaeosine synthase
MFEVIERNGLARIGSWDLEEQDLNVKTPNIFFIANEGIKPPQEAEVLISDSKNQEEKPIIESMGSLFSIQRKKITDYTVSPHLVFPLSQDELNAFSAGVNKIKLQSRIFVATGKGSSISDAVSGVDAEVYILANALHMLRRPKECVETLVNLREAIGYQNLIYTPGLGAPSHIALLAYLGVDLFDSIPSILNARMGNYLTTQGKIIKDELYEDFCFCPACRTEKNGFDTVLAHNYYTSLAELKLVRGSIYRGNLREHVESRVVAESHMVSMLRIFDSHFYHFQEKHLPTTGRVILAASYESLFRPEIVRFRERVSDRYRKPPHKKVLLMLPCSAKKPYSFSRSHKAFTKAVRECGNDRVVHEVIITSPLGVVPREVELFYPAQQYDIPVTRTWSKDEIAMICDCLRGFLEQNHYDNIIVHLPDDYMFVGDCFDDFTRTCNGGLTSQASLESLRQTLTEAVKPHKKVGGQIARREALSCFAQFQFGTAGTALLEDAQVKGRYPNLRIFNDGAQTGMLVGQRGLISLTLAGGEVMAEHSAYWVRISDFEPKGNIFAVGVEDADSEIRIGDDVVVLRNNKLVGVGVAMMSPEEMIKSSRGEAVRIRHLVKTK